MTDTTTKGKGKKPKQLPGGRKAGKLSPRHQAFAIEWMRNGGDATEAYLATGHVVNPENRDSIKSAASRMLKLPQVQAFIKSQRDKACDAAVLELADLLREVKRIALLDPAAFFDASGNLLPVKEMPEDARRALASFDVERRFERGASEDDPGTEIVVDKVRAHSKLDAIDKGLRVLGAYKDKVQMEVTGDDFLKRFAAANERAAARLKDQGRT